MPLIAERWDRFKLKRLMDKYQITSVKLSHDMRLSKWEVEYMLKGKAPIIEHELFLTNYQSALKIARIKETVAYCNEMVKYYEQPT